MSAGNSLDLSIPLGATLVLVTRETTLHYVAEARDEKGNRLDYLATSSTPFDGPTITLLAAIAESRWPTRASWPQDAPTVTAAVQQKFRETPHSYQRVQGQAGVWSCKHCGGDRGEPQHGA